MGHDLTDLSGLWTRAIEFSSPKMLRGVVGGAFFVEALRWVPDIQNSDVDLVLQYGCVGGAAISAAVLLWGVASGR